MQHQSWQLQQFKWLKQSLSPWAVPTRVNTYKRGEAPQPAAKKRVPSVVVHELAPKPPSFSAKLPKLNEISNQCFAAFLTERLERSGEDL